VERFIAHPTRYVKHKNEKNCKKINPGEFPQF
jgi:hypothetical protein